MSFRHTLTAALLPAFLVGLAGAETIDLQGGARITGEVLKSTDEVVVVDVGYDVLRLPRGQIVRIHTQADSGLPTRPTSRATTGPAKEQTDGWQLFRTAELQSTTIERSSRQFGEAVVMVVSPAGQGSGFIISPDGYCITNYHVIARETRIKVTVFRRSDTGYEQKHYKKVRIVALNPAIDLALLKIDGEGDTFKYAYLGDMGELQVGQRVFAIGNPLGLTRTVSQGIVSTTNRNFQGLLYIQTTTDINPGNSGGPLFNLKGEVIGVTSMGYLFLGGLNFAIPVDVVKWFVTNRDAFAYDEDNPNSGYRYLQPAGRLDKRPPQRGKLPAMEPARSSDRTPNQPNRNPKRKETS